MKPLSNAPFAKVFQRIAIDQLDDAAKAAYSLEKSSEGDALHDFRVSIRRLATLLKAYRSETKDFIPRKSVKRLRKLFSSTNSTRDAQVELAWLGDFAKEADELEKPGLSALAGELRNREIEGQGRILEKGLKRFRRTERKLRKRLARLARSKKLRPSFEEVARRVLRKAARKTQRRLHVLRGRLDVESLHRARIAIKRLRYLVEPFRQESRVAREAVERLMELQDCLGEIHDRDLLASDIGENPSLARPILKLRSEQRELCEKALKSSPRLAVQRLV